MTVMSVYEAGLLCLLSRLVMSFPFSTVGLMSERFSIPEYHQTAMFFAASGELFHNLKPLTREREVHASYMS